MNYMGSKNRIAKYLKPIIESYITEDTVAYIEPFVGGANMIDKIDFDNKVGYDNNKYLIALLKQAQTDVSVFPEIISEHEYQDVRLNKDRYPDWYVGLVGFCATFGAKWFNGYGRQSDKTSKSPSRIASLKGQSPSIKEIEFDTKCYTHLDTSVWSNCVVYCDPPYKGTTKYNKDFNHEHFYQWVRSIPKSNVVLVSEYSMPDDFECIWEKEHSVSFSSLRDCAKRSVERLYVYKGEN